MYMYMYMYVYACIHVHVQMYMYMYLNTQCEVLDKAHEEQKAAVTEAQQALHKAKDRREEMEQDTDRMREEIAAWYSCKHAYPT